MKKINLHEVNRSRLDGSDRFAHCCCYFDQDDDEEQVTECNHHKELRDEVERLRKILASIHNKVPTNWLDPLLTGPKAVIKDPTDKDTNIEK